VKTSSEVADPKWKGKILLTDPRVADNYMGWLDGMERRFRMDFPKKIAAQDSKLTQSGASDVQMVAAGAYPINFPSFPISSRSSSRRRRRWRSSTSPIRCSSRCAGLGSCRRLRTPTPPGCS